MARYGPLTKDTTTVALGLAQIRIGNSADNITRPNPVLSSSDSIGAMASTKFTADAEYFKLESGFPLMEDTIFPLRESAMLECTFKEITPYNLALARGVDPTGGAYPNNHSGSVKLGTLATPAFIRMEALYTFPDQTNSLYIIFPRAQVSSSVELDLAEEDVAAVPVTIESKRADSDTSGGHSTWDDMPLGQLIWATSGTVWTTTTTTTSSTSSSTTTTAP